MGATYSNIVLKGTEQTSVVEFLLELGQTAYVSPNSNGYVIIWPDEKRAPVSVACLGSLISLKFDCVALAVSVYDDKDMIYELHRSGKLLDMYDSFPMAPNDLVGLHPVVRPPKGGSAEELCAAFDVPNVVDRVRGILHNDPSGEDSEPREMPPPELAEKMKQTFSADIFTRTAQRRKSRPYVFEQERHKALGKAIGVPDAIGGVDFEYVADSQEDGEITDEVGLPIAFVKCEKPGKAKEFYLVRVPNDVNLEQDIVEPLIMDLDLAYRYPIGEKSEIMRQVTDALPTAQFSTDTYLVLKTDVQTVEANLGTADPVNSVLLSVSGRGTKQLVKTICAKTGWRAIELKGFRWMT